MNTDRTVRKTPHHIHAEWYFPSPHACPCSNPNKSHVIHSLRPCRNSPLSKTKLNSHTTFWDYIWFERYLHVFSECSYYHKHYEMRSSSFNEKHHSNSHSSKCQWLNKKPDIFSYTFIIHIPSSHCLTYYTWVFREEKISFVSDIITNFHLQQEEDVVWEV